MKPLIPTGPVPAFPANPDPIRSAPDETRHAALRKAAAELETAFLTEMLKSTGFGQARDSFGGGAGEDQFSSILVRAQAEQMTMAGGIGLAESLFHALLETKPPPAEAGGIETGADWKSTFPK